MLRLFAWVALAFACAACTPTAPAKTVALADGAVIATTPEGYCVDGPSSQLRNGFAVLAPCATLGDPGPVPKVVGVATIQVGPPDSAAVEDAEIPLRDFLITDAGNALLSADGKDSEVTILSTQAFNNRVMVHFIDKGTAPLPGLQGEEWRAFTDVNGRLVTIAVRGLASAPLQDGPGAGLLKLVLGGVKAPPDEPTETPTDDPEA